MKYALDHGSTVSGWYSKFKTDGNLQDTSEGCEAYRIIAEAVDLFLSFDQINLAECAGGSSLALGPRVSSIRRVGSPAEPPSATTGGVLRAFAYRTLPAHFVSSARGSREEAFE